MLSYVESDLNHDITRLDTKEMMNFKFENPEEYESSHA